MPINPRELLTQPTENGLYNEDTSISPGCPRKSDAVCHRNFCIYADVPYTIYSDFQILRGIHNLSRERTPLQTTEH